MVVAQPLIGLTLEPKIEDRNKFLLPGSQNNVEAPDNQNSNNKVSSGLDNDESLKVNGAQHEANDDENRIVLTEPYKSLIQATARLAVAQSSLTDYVTVDTAMDVISDAGYALSKPSTLSRVFKAVVIAIASLAASALVLPGSLMRSLDATIRNPERLLKLDQYLPSGLSKMNILGLLHQKNEDFMARFGLNDGVCREQTVCQVGELVRCTFPRTSNVTISFIKENLSRPKYKNNKYLNAFLSGFMEQNCSVENDNLPKSCASNLIKSFTFCPPPPPKPNCQ